jgi:hypothetical protein
VARFVPRVAFFIKISYIYRAKPLDKLGASKSYVARFLNQIGLQELQAHQLLEPKKPQEG